MIKNKIRILISTVLFSFALFLVWVFASFNNYIAVKYFLTGDIGLKNVFKSYKVKFIPQKTIVYPQAPKGGFAVTWAFRPSHAVPTYPIPVVGDINHDGSPEVFIGSYSKAITVLDGKSGKILWQWHLPFGVVGGRVMALADVDKDGEQELLVGSHTSLPIRIYALKTGLHIKESKRVLWKKNLSGDFLEGGINVYSDDLTRNCYILLVTRDAPYSRGSLQVLDGNGDFLFTPIEGFDNCISRPPIGRIKLTDTPIVVTGNHNFYSPEWGYRFTARNLYSGKLIWSTGKIGDGGYMHHAISDFNFDGNNEIFVSFLDSSRKVRHWLLDAATGEKIKSVDWDIQGFYDQNDLFLVSQNDSSYCMNQRHEQIFKIPKIDFSFKDGYLNKRYLFKLKYESDTLVLIAYDAFNGKQLDTFYLNLQLQDHDPLSDYGFFGRPSSKPGFLTLADTDNDGFWDILIQIKDYIVNVKLPYQINCNS